MTVVLIVLAVVVAVLIIAALALNPVIRKANDKAIARAWERLGRDNIKVIEPKAVGLGTEPEEAGGVRGQGCLAINGDELLFVTTAGQKELAIPRSAISSVDTEGDPRSPMKTTITVQYTDPTHGSVSAKWRLPDSPSWLRELGYDWGPEGPPSDEAE
jgi:hypothetical protein